MTHVAFDLGLDRAGVAWPGGSDSLRCPPSFPRCDDYPGRRLRWWASTYDTILTDHRPDTVAIEGPVTHGRPMDGANALLYVHGVLRLVAAQHRCRVVTVQPNTLKKYATGYGRASKEQMLAEARRRGCDTASFDEADALLVWCWWADSEHVRGDSAPVISDTVTKGGTP